MEEFLNTYKTTKCPNFCKKAECLDYHDASDYRRAVINYSPYMCLEAIKNDFCLHKRCQFCSNYTEFAYHPENYKKKKCIYSSIGLNCNTLQVCPNYHTEEERSDYIKQFSSLSSRKVQENVMEIKAKSVNSKKILNENIEIQVIEEEKLEDLANIKYMYGEEINKFEDRNNEFKECKGKNFDISTACLMISSYVSAFLNTEGGTIYYGVADNGLITGIKMNRKGRDLFTQSFDNILNKFRPAIGPSLYRMNYAPVYNKQRKVIPDLYVIEIEVTQGDLDKIYFTHKEEAFVKRDSSVSQLKGPSLLEFSRLRQA